MEQISKLLYCSTEKDVSEILPGLWLGNYKAAISSKFIKKHEISCIINISDDVPNLFDKIDYLHIPIKDSSICLLNTYRSTKLYDITTDFINQCLLNGKNILVHCKRGHHRSACVVAAYLIKYRNFEYSNAINYINSIRKCALVRNTCMMKALLKYYIILTTIRNIKKFEQIN